MHNVTYELKNNKLTVVMDLSPKAIKEAPDSSTGSSAMVASSGGKIPVGLPDGKVAQLSAMLYIPYPKKR